MLKLMSVYDIVTFVNATYFEQELAKINYTYSNNGWIWLSRLTDKVSYVHMT